MPSGLEQQILCLEIVRNISYFPCKNQLGNYMQSIDNKIVSRIYGKGRSWTFSNKDFSNSGHLGAVDLALHRC